MDQRIRNIFINATATQPGGGYTILLQFLKAYSENPLPNAKIYVFNSIDIGNNISPYITSVDIPRLSYIKRIFWDWKGMKNWSDKNNIKPDLILSFQNTGVRFAGVPQVIYLHQPLPFVQHQWNLFKKEERTMWMYKNIYPIFIGLTLFKDTNVIVQTNWMKKAFLEKFKNFDTKRVYIFSPEINIADIEGLNNVSTNSHHQQNKFTFFYPASNYIYKNHIEIIKAFAAIKSENKNWNALCHFTIPIEGLSVEAQKLIEINDLHSNFVFLGPLPLQEVYNHYKKIDALIFPSYIETFGLPLIEGAAFGLPILAADEPYAKEVLSEYKNVRYATVKKTNEWEKMITEVMKLKKTNPQKLSLSRQSWPDMIELVESLINK